MVERQEREEERREDRVKRELRVRSGEDDKRAGEGWICTRSITATLAEIQ